MSGYEAPVAPGQEARPDTSGKAIASLVCGILSFVLLPIVLSVAALVLGYGARREIDAEPARFGGRGMAIAGIVLGWLSLVISALFVVFVLVGL